MPKTVHDFAVPSIDGAPVALADYAGKVLLMVNVASACGYTPQYAGLERLQKRYQPRGLRVLGFPCNDFGAQEPGSEAEIKSFCETSYGVTFPMFAKVRVKGDGATPLFAWLQNESPFPGSIPWNFSKFLVGKDGSVVARFAHGVDPEAPDLVQAVERALGA
jgi:glutathione peroxidase